MNRFDEIYGLGAEPETKTDLFWPVAIILVLGAVAWVGLHPKTVSA